MSTPLSFIKNDIAGTIQTLSHVAPFAQEFLLRNGAGKMYQAGSSHVLQQTFAGPGCWLLRYDFFHPQPSKWQLQPTLNHSALLYVFRRQITLSLDGGRTIELKEGFCYLLKLQAMQQIVTSFLDGHTEILWIALNEQFIQHLEFVDTRFSVLRNEDVEGRRIPNSIQLHLHQLSDFRDDPHFFRTFVHGRITDVLLDRLSAPAEDVFDPKYRRLLDVKKYIEENIGSRLALRDLSRRAAMNMSELQRRFRKAFGSSVDRYQLEVRMQKAADMLVREKDLAIGDIGWKVGYREESSFIRIFKRHFGITPLQYRKRYRD